MLLKIITSIDNNISDDSSIKKKFIDWSQRNSISWNNLTHYSDTSNNVWSAEGSPSGNILDDNDKIDVSNTKISSQQFKDIVLEINFLFSTND